MPTSASQAGEAEEVTISDGEPDEFDFDQHGRDVAAEFLALAPLHAPFADAVERVLSDAISAEEIVPHSVSNRVKAPESLEAKAKRPDPENPDRPKYPNGLVDITDLAGVRVITYLLDDVDRVCAVIESQFDVLERITRTSLIDSQANLGYRSEHFLVRFGEPRSRLPEYATHGDLVCEIQVRTILQHAWAEIEHDIQYKAAESIPVNIRKRFASLAGLLEIADREFQGISTEDQEFRENATRFIQNDELERVEITPSALKEFLDQRVGEDRRMSDWSYEWMSRLLRNLGFSDFRQVEEAVSGYDDDAVSRAVWGRRRGQLERFELMLLAGTGEIFVDRHMWGNESWFRDGFRTKAALLERNGIAVKNYDPLAAGQSEGAAAGG